MSGDASARRAFGNIGQVDQIDLALGEAGVTPKQVNRLVSDPFARQQVADLLASREPTLAVLQEAWIQREINVLNVLSSLGLDCSDNCAAAIRELAEGGCYGQHHYFIPGELSIAVLGRVGHSVDKRIRNFDGDISIPPPNNVPTTAGVLECRLSEIMTPTDSDHRPFHLSYEEQVAWARQHHGCGLTSVEEALWLLIRARLELDKFPFVGGRIRCRNSFLPQSHTPKSARRGGLGIVVLAYDCRVEDLDAEALWSCGAIPRRFIPYPLYPPDIS